MVLHPYSTPFLEVAYRPDLSQLTGRWLHAVTDPELRMGYDALRRAALHYGCTSWLIDTRRRTTRSLSGSEWLVSRFLPQARRELGSSLHVGFLVLPGYVGALASADDVLVAAPGDGVQFATFLDEGSANDWLAARLAAGVGADCPR